MIPENFKRAIGKAFKPDFLPRQEVKQNKSLLKNYDFVFLYGIICRDYRCICEDLGVNWVFMDKAVDSLYSAVINKETIGIFGDYDVDGACSAAIVSSFLTSLGCNIEIHIPDRFTEGYGPNRGMRNTSDAVYGVRKVDQNHPDAIQFTNSRGVVGYGAPLRPGVDVSGWPGRYNPMYGYVGESVIGTFNVSANMDPNCNDWPYPNGCASNHEKFEFVKISDER